MNPKISVIITVYNSETYLNKCLDSVLNQSFKDYEVIIVNDGSTDGSEEICKHYVSKYKKVKLISQTNRGVAEARNSAFKVCSGEYLAFADSDDFVEINWLQNFIDEINANPKCQMVVQGITIDYFDYCNEIVIDYGKYFNKDIIMAYRRLKGYYTEGFLVNKLYRRDIIINNKLSFKFTLKEDLLFNLHYLYFISSVSTVPSCCYHYVQRGSQSLVHRRYSADYMKSLITELKDAGLRLADRFNDSMFHESVIEEYMLSFSVLIFGMYRGTGKINCKEKRILYLNEYHNLHKQHRNIKIRTGSFTKRAFAFLILAPSRIVDGLLYWLLS